VGGSLSSCRRRAVSVSVSGGPSSARTLDAGPDGFQSWAHFSAPPSCSPASFRASASAWPGLLPLASTAGHSGRRVSAEAGRQSTVTRAPK
jgi:hypothetical protein